MATELMQPNSLHLNHAIQEVTSRLHKRNRFEGAMKGFLGGCIAAVLLAGCFTIAAPDQALWVSILAVLGTVVAGSLVGLVAGSLVPTSPLHAVRLIDQYYQLKDHALSAFEFSNNPDSIRNQQVADAELYLRHVRADDCVAIQPKRSHLYGAGICGALALGMIGFSAFNRSEATAAPLSSLAEQQANELRSSMLEEIEQLKKEADQPELEELTAKLDEMLEELKNESIDERDMLAKLSEMEQAIAEAQQSMQLEASDAQMKGLAEAIQPSDAMKQAAAAMEQGDYEKASEKLETIDPNAISDKERRAVADNLKKFMAKLDPGQKGQLSGSAAELQEGLEKSNPSKCKDGLCKLAGECKKQSNLKKIGECMACQLNRLSQCKGECRGQCEGNKLAKSNRPSQKAGNGSTGNPNDGPSTNLPSTRAEQQLTGVQGDGPSESEVIQAPEGEQDAVRQYAKRYQQFRSQAEAVLDSEPLPLGHRETVRQYFENIRPANVEAQEVDSSK